MHNHSRPNKWTETVDLGVNFIADVDPAKITQSLKHIHDNYSEIKSRLKNNPFGGNASEKIVKILKDKLPIY